MDGVRVGQSLTMTQITEERRFTRQPEAATPLPADAVEHAIRHTTLRALGFVGMMAIALIHLLDVIGKIKETPYLGFMYIGLMVASVAVALYLLHTGSVRAWAAAGLLAAATLVGFVLSRTTGLPQATGDIGNWSEGLGLASMFVEAGVIVLAGYAMALARRERRPGVHVSLGR
jgi:asparagine N-glycosylation enzyme membrane subunit Stt3